MLDIATGLAHDQRGSALKEMIAQLQALRPGGGKLLIFSVLRTVSGLAALRSLYLHQLDFDTAFLNAALDEELGCSLPRALSPAAATAAAAPPATAAAALAVLAARCATGLPPAEVRLRAEAGAALLVSRAQREAGLRSVHCVLSTVCTA